MEPIDYAGALRRSWRLLIGLAVLGAVIAALLPAGHTKHVKSALPYQASALVGTPPNGGGSPLNGSVTSSQIQFFGNDSATQKRVAQSLGLSIPEYALSTYMSATTVAAGGTGVAPSKGIKRGTVTNVQLTGYGATAADATALANGFAVELGNVVEEQAVKRQAQNPKSAASSNPNATIDTGYTVIHSALIAARTGAGGKANLGASRKVRVGAGLAIGAGIGAALVLLRELLDKRLRNAARAEANFGFPVVVEVPLATLGTTPATASLAPAVDVIREPHTPGAEAYRMLRMSVMFEALAPASGPTDPYALGFDAGNGSLLATDQRVEVAPPHELGDRRVVLVVSAGSEPTRPHVAANLAAIYAEAGDRVVVISTGDVETGFNGAGGAGTNVNDKIRTKDIEAHLEPSRLENVSRLPMGPFLSRGGQLVTRMPAILEAARTVCDVIIVEVPPLLAIHHAEALVHAADVVLVVAESRFTTFDQARRAGDLLRRMGAPVLGVVLTNVRLDRTDIRHSTLVNSSAVEGETSHDEESVLALSAAPGSSSTSST